MAKELGRKIIHVLSGIALMLLISYNIINTLILFYILILGCILSVLSLRLKIPIISWFLREFGKEEEKIPGRGMIFFVAGSLLAMKLFSIDIALASIAILTFSDSSSCLIGKYCGNTKIIGRKNIEGMIFGFLIGTIVALFFISFPEAFLAAAGSMIIEYVEVKVSDKNIDDNLLIPLVSGTIIYFLRGVL